MSDVLSFSAALRERSRSAHSTSEHAGFMADLMSGAGTREDYVALVTQHWFIYAALEEATDRMRLDPVASVFLSDKLTRLPAIEADLAFLIGPEWREVVTPLPTTQAYVARIRRPPLHALPRRPVGRAVHRASHATSVRLRDERHRLLPLR